MCLSHESLANYYMTNFALMYDLNKDPSMFDNVMPFEKQIYIDMLLQRLKEKQQQKGTTAGIPTEAEYKASQGM
jgi:hypothetical protein